jgi:hypothetical protein
MEPIMTKLQDTLDSVLRTLRLERTKWLKKLRTQRRKLERNARARWAALSPRKAASKRTKKGRFAKKPAIRPVQAAA